MKACDGDFLILLKVLAIFEELVIHLICMISMFFMSVVLGDRGLRQSMGKFVDRISILRIVRILGILGILGRLGRLGRL